MAGEFFRMRNIVKSYRMGGEEQVVLKGIDLDIQPGEFLSILGPSGSGKTTLMNLIGCLDTPTSGEYILDGQLIRALSEKELARIRSREIGFIFQQFQLLPRMTAQKIIRLHHTKKDLADSLLEGTDLSHKLTREEILELLRQE